jgi:anti-sigma-K factor RskA
VKNEELDRFIIHSLEKQELEVPASLQERVRQRAAALAVRPRPAAWKRTVFWASLAAAAMLLAVVSLALLFSPRTPEKRISQIRTEFSIPEKNIKIVWVQRDDFRLPETNG